MATKEKRSSLSKQIEKEKSESPDGVKKRGRKSSLIKEKSSSAPNSPVPTRKRKVDEGRQTPQPAQRGTKKLEDEELMKTTPSPFSRSRKSFLEKELEDLLENATGRNTPSLPRTRKVLEKEEDDGLVLPGLSRTRRDIDDDLISVRSFSTRGKKSAQDDDTSSVRSFVMRAKKSDSLTEDSKKDKAKLEEKPAAEKKRLGRPKKVVDSAENTPSVPAIVKKVIQRKKPIKGQKRANKVVKRILKKQLPHKAKLSTTKRRLLRSALMKKKMLLKSPLKKKAVVVELLKVKKGRGVRKVKADEEKKTKVVSGSVVGGAAVEDAGDKVKVNKTAAAKTVPGVKLVRKKVMKKTLVNKPAGDLESKDVYVFSENENEESKKLAPETPPVVKPKVRRTSKPPKVKEEKQIRKRKREKSIHFDSERSPDDSSVIIVKPRLGPKKRKKDLLAEASLQQQKTTGLTAAAAAAATTASAATPATVNNNPFLVLSPTPPIVPKFNNPIVNPKFNAEIPIGPRNLPYIEKSEDCIGTTFPKIPNELIITPSGVVLSTSTTNTINTPSIIFQNLGAGFTTLTPDLTKAQLVLQTCISTLQQQHQQHMAAAGAQPTEQTKNSLPTITNTPELSRLNNKQETTAEDVVEEEKNGQPTEQEDATKTNNNQCYILFQEALPKIPVAKSVNDLFMLKELDRGNENVETENKPPVLEPDNRLVDSENQSPGKIKKKYSISESRRKRRNSDMRLSSKKLSNKKTNSSINLTTPSFCINKKLKKRRRNVRKNLSTKDTDIIFSDPETSYQSSPRFDVNNDKYQSTENLYCDYNIRPNITDIKHDSSVFSFSKENQHVLKELGLDSDLEKSDPDVKLIEKTESIINLDTALKQVNLTSFTKLSPVKSEQIKLNFKPLTPPTVIDILLEKNKSLKKAEEEGILSTVNQHENLCSFECSKKSLRDFRTKKFTKGVESKRKPDKLHHRRGSNPEIYKTDTSLTPLRRIHDNNIQRRISHVDRRMSLSLSLPSDEIKTEDDNCGNNIFNERRISYESSSSCSDNFSKIIDELNNLEESRKDKLVPYINNKNDNSKSNNISDENNLKIRLQVDNKQQHKVEENPEDLVNKETILSALGLQSLKAAAQNAQKKKETLLQQQQQQQTQNQSSATTATVTSCVAQSPYSSNYTGTLKTVIKIHRPDKKGNSKSPVKMIYKSVSSVRETSPSDEIHANGGHSSAANSSVDHDTDNNSREGSEEANSDENKNGNGKAKALVIPEKASSFSIHPGRMCSDVCTYCFGKFGLLDTPCHVAQLKDSDRRRNILATEIHLTADSCLCDACFRHVDKKSNCPTFTEKKYKRKYPGRKQLCTVLNCNTLSTHHVRRRSYTKLKKSIGRKLVLDPVKLDKLQTGNIITLCQVHMYWIDYFMSCGICKRRLTNVNMYRLGSEVEELNMALSADAIPAIMTEKRFLCKVCRCYASIRTKFKDPADMSANHRQFYDNCRKRILYCHGIEVPDSGPENDGDQDMNQKNGKLSKKKPRPTNPAINEHKQDQEIPRDIEITIEKEKEEFDEDDKDLSEVTHMNIPPTTKTNLDFGGVSISSKTKSEHSQNPTQIHVKLGNLNIGALGNLNIGQDASQGNRPEISIHQCFPTENELPLVAHFDFNEDESAKQARHGFEKCTATLQFNRETKQLFKDLQLPYGNQSSFMRHLVLLEKYFRNGDLVISRNADSKAVNYISSVQNRIRSYEGMLGVSKKQQQQQQTTTTTQQPVPQLMNLTPSVTILPQPKTDKYMPSLNPLHTEKPPSVSLLPSRPFTLTPMNLPAFQIAKTTVTPVYSTDSPLSQMQATVQNIPGVVNKVPNLGNAITLTSVSQSVMTPPKPDISIVSVMNNTNTSQMNNKTKMVSLLPPNPVLTSKLQENLRNLASKTKPTTPGSASSTSAATATRAVILNRTVGGQKQSFVQVTTGGKTIHLTLSQFKRIQQMQMKKKQYLDKQKPKNREKKLQQQLQRLRDEMNDEMCPTDNLEVEIQELSTNNSDNETNADIFPKICDVRSLARDETNELQWDTTIHQTNGPNMKPLSVSVTKIPLRSD